MSAPSPLSPPLHFWQLTSGEIVSPAGRCVPTQTWILTAGCCPPPFNFHVLCYSSSFTFIPFFFYVLTFSLHELTQILRCHVRFWGFILSDLRLNPCNLCPNPTPFHFLYSHCFCILSLLSVLKDLMATSHLKSLFYFFDNLSSPLIPPICANFFLPRHPVLCGEHIISNLSKKWFQQKDLLGLVQVLEQLSSQPFQWRPAWNETMHGLEKGPRKIWKVNRCFIFHSNCGHT